jgi:hypothetical protein
MQKSFYIAPFYHVCRSYSQTACLAINNRSPLGDLHKTTDFVARLEGRLTDGGMIGRHPFYDDLVEFEARVHYPAERFDIHFATLNTEIVVSIYDAVGVIDRRGINRQY